MKAIWYEAEIFDIIDESPKVKRFWFRMPPEANFSFKAGQFVMLDLPIQAKYTNRSYSISSAPTDDSTFELCIVLKEDGIGTTWVWENIKVGSKIKTAGPLGKFILPEVIDKDICFICTGTGIAPLRSQLMEIFNKNIPHKDIYMIFGNRIISDVLYRKEMEELEAEHPEFHFIPVLSRETPETWNHLGYVHKYYLDLYGDKQKPVMFYICGWSSMVREARDKLRELGYTKDELKFELYD